VRLSALFCPCFVSYQGLNAQFYYGDFTKPLITVPFLQASTLNLPFGYHCINHTRPREAPTWNMADCAIIDSSGVQQTLWNGQTYSRTRAPTKFININAASIAAEATIWTPTAGRRFRLMGYVLESGTIGGNVLLQRQYGWLYHHGSCPSARLMASSSPRPWAMAS